MTPEEREYHKFLVFISLDIPVDKNLYFKYNACGKCRAFGSLNVGCRSEEYRKKNFFKKVDFTNGDNNIRYCILWEPK